MIGEAISVLEGLFWLKRKVDRNSKQMWLCGAGTTATTSSEKGDSCSYLLTLR
jgi:hypothetical protein